VQSVRLEFVTPMRIVCPACRTTWELDERLVAGGRPVQCTRCQLVFKATRFESPVQSVRVARSPLAFPVQRAWLEVSGQPTVVPLIRPSSDGLVTLPGWPGSDPSVSLGFRHGGWTMEGAIQIPVNGVLTQLSTNAITLESGRQVLLGFRVVTFRESGCVVVKKHHAALDDDPRNPEAWRVWADALLEQEDRLGEWLMEKLWSDFELDEHLGALVRLVRQGHVAVTWNAFGFLEAMTLDAAMLAEHPWVTDVHHVPAARYLFELTVNRSARSVLIPALDALPLPRSLQVLRFPEPVTEGLLGRLRVRSPRLLVS
jgi:predicted Zn finger-like uncharacterized protein